MTTRKVPAAAFVETPGIPVVAFFLNLPPGTAPVTRFAKHASASCCATPKLDNLMEANVGLDNDRDGDSRRPLYHVGGVLVAAIILAVCRYAVPVGGHDLAEVNVNTTYFHVAPSEAFGVPLVAPGIQKIAVSTIHSTMLWILCVVPSEHKRTVQQCIRRIRLVDVATLSLAETHLRDYPSQWL